MYVDLFIKKMPRAIKELIGREAARNRRSLNQEAIALLEEALLGRVRSPDHRLRSARAILEGLASGEGAAVVAGPAVALLDPGEQPDRAAPGGVAN